MAKIYCEEKVKDGFDDYSFKELQDMIGWIEPPNKGEKCWTVTMADGDFFEWKTQEMAQVMATGEETKAILLRRYNF